MAQPGLFVDLHFSAILRDEEIRLLNALPDWPTQAKLSDAEREVSHRLKRLGLIEIERCKDDPIQIFFDVYAGATFLGRRAAADGVVRLG